MADNGMVERVRKAIDDAYTEAMALNLPGDVAETLVATRAIEAMREPTEAMCEAGGKRSARLYTPASHGNAARLESNDRRRPLPIRFPGVRETLRAGA